MDTSAANSVAGGGGNLVAAPNLDRSTQIKVGEQVIEIDPDNVTVIKELGHGAYGIVELIQHEPSGVKLAVKKIRASNLQDETRLLRDMEVLVKSRGCPTIVEFYGAIFWESDVYLFMEIMDSSLDKFYRLAYAMAAAGTGTSPAVPEAVIGRIAGSVVSALHYLYTLKVIHRDVKPSNILINRTGIVKLCDFGISGYLVNSVAMTNEAGCKPYMAPERLRPRPQGYDIKSDVWSLGLTLFEIATGAFPYPHGNLFEQLKSIFQDPPPKLPANRYSPEFEDFIVRCLEKEYQNRPNYLQLLELPFIKTYADADIADFTRVVLDSAPEQCNSASPSSPGKQPSVATPPTGSPPVPT